MNDEGRTSRAPNANIAATDDSTLSFVRLCNVVPAALLGFADQTASDLCRHRLRKLARKHQLHARRAA